jgi:neutral ceramidase
VANEDQMGTDKPARAGWATTDITPPLGLPMGGRGTRYTPGAEVLDPLLMQALILEDAAGERVLWLSLDMIGLSWTMSARFRHELAAQTGISFAHIVLNFSHTHSGPMSGFEGYATERPQPPEMAVYEEGLIGKAVLLLHEALRMLAPATLRWHHGSSQIGINRRARDEQGQMGLRPNADGHYNTDLWVLDICAEGVGRCVAFSHGCHPVIVYGYAWDAISADFPGVCRRALKERLGEGVHAQFFQGLAGNVRPRLLANLEMGKFDKGNADSPIKVGRELAGDVLAALAVEGAELELKLAVAATWVMAERDQGFWPLAHWQDLTKSANEMQRELGQYWSRRYTDGLPPVRAVPWEMGLLQLSAEFRIAYFSGEVLGEWLPLLRTWLSDEKLVAWAYCQDGRGYMPTDALLAEGGYEVLNSNHYNKSGPDPFKEGLDARVKRAFLQLYTQLKNEGSRL